MSLDAIKAIVKELREKYSAGPWDPTAWALNELELRLEAEWHNAK